MPLQSLYPEIRGTRNGNSIRFTCPQCATIGVIVNSSPRDHFKESRVAGCKQCKSRMTVLTPGKDN